MLRRDVLSWIFRPSFLQPWGRPSRTLFAGPWIGEFGWEIMSWQGFLRKLSPRYERVIVCCRKGNEALYEDFCREFVFHDVRGTAECNTAHDIKNPESLRAALAQVPPGSDLLRPLGYQPLDRQRFVRYGRAREDRRFDVVLHPRARGFGTERNWSSGNWNELAARLRARGLRVASIGLPDQTVAVEGAEDFRGISLRDTLDLLASSRLAAGPSSGPMHLASLCGTPHLVWTDASRNYARGVTNREKYERIWNPLGTPVTVLDAHGFNPPVDEVFRGVSESLATGPKAR